MFLSKLGNRIFYGWWIVIACFIIHFYTGGTYFYGFTAFFNPLVEEFGWSYALISLAVSIRGLEAGFLAPVAGFLVDKFGPKRLLIFGIVFIGIGFLLLNRVDALWNFYLAFVVLALGLSFASPVITMTAVTRWFKGKRTSLALGVLMTGYAAGGLAVPGVIWVIDQFDWRMASIIFGIAIFIVILPLTFLIKDPPQVCIPASADKEPSSPKSTSAVAGLTAKEALRNRDFWLLSFVVLLAAIAGTAISVHLVPYMTSIGISRPMAGLVASAFAGGGIIGRLLFGWLGDIYDKRIMFAIVSLSNAIGALWFTLTADIIQLIIATLLLSIGFGGAITLRPGLQNDLFGIKAFGSISGMLMIFATLTFVISPTWAGWMFDMTKSYFIAFLVLAIISFIAVPLSLAIRKQNQNQFT